MKKFIYIFLTLMLLAVVVWKVEQEVQVTYSEPQGNYVEINGQKIPVELAETPNEQWRGLSGREKLDAGSGMLFVFPGKGVRNFWLKDMNFPLDIIWIDENTVVKVDRNLPPGGPAPNESYSSIWPINYVLEVNAGFAEKHDIRAGDEVVYSFK